MQHHHSRRLVIALAAVVAAFALATATTRHGAAAAPAPSSLEAAVETSFNPCDWAVVSTVCGAVGTVVGGAAGAVAGDVTKAVTGWVADAAASVLQGTLDLANSAFTPDLGGSAIAGYVQRMSGLAALTGVLWLLFVVIQAVAAAAPTLLLDGVKRLAIAAVATTGIVWGTQLLLRVADEMTAIVVGDRLTGDAGGFLTNLGDNFHTAIDGGQTSLFLVAAAAVMTVVVGLLLFIELAIRAAAVDLGVVFLPLLLVASVWPPAARASRRLVSVLITAIFSKFVIFVALGLAVALFAGGTSASSGMAPAGWVVSPIAAQSAAHPAQSIGGFVVGVVLLLLAALAPMALLSFIGHAPEAVASLAAVRRGGAVAAVQTGARVLRPAVAAAGGGNPGGLRVLSGRPLPARGAGTATRQGDGVPRPVAWPAAAGGPRASQGRSTLASPASGHRSSKAARTRPPRRPDGGGTAA